MKIPKENKTEWSEYFKLELSDVTPILSRLGFSLDEQQVHTIGERFLMSGKKLVLTGKRISDNKKVIIKASSDVSGKAELLNEHLCRETIKKIDFAYKPILLPEEILFVKEGAFVVVISGFIEEPQAFLAHSDQEQFFLALRAFEMLDSVHSTAHSHTKIIESVWSNWGAAEYLKMFSRFSNNIITAEPDLYKTVSSAEDFLKGNREMLDRYSGFLTHEDFVPHNLRISGQDVYLLDHTALLFGNKYESVARFLNYLCIYNLKLERWIIEYIKKNRCEEEYLALRLMRTYKLAELLQFYTGSLAQTEGNLKLLAKERIEFWKKVMITIIEDKPVTEEMVQEYTKKRDSLRSEDEKKRQKEIHQL